MISIVRRIFLEGFRVFFLSAGLFALFAGIVWSFWFADQMTLGIWTKTPFAVPPHQWHGHEMIFGYSSAALGGFLLTAVPNWTGAPGARIAFIATATVLWFAGRGALWQSGMINPVLVAVLDLSFLPMIMVRIAVMLFKRPKPQNVMFLAFLTVFWIANLLVHLEWIGVTFDTADQGMRSGTIALCTMIAVLGGRVTPAFTRNAMKRAGVPEVEWPVPVARIDRVALVAAILLPFAVILAMPAIIVGPLAITTGAVQALRLSRWKGAWTIGQPILLALHSGFLMLCIGLVLWGASLLGLGSEVAALHVLGIGAVGGMTVAVMSRAILGHTGRALIAPRPIAIAYGLIPLAAILRWLGSTLPGEWYFPLIFASGVLWCLAFGLYTVSIWPAVSQPRQAESA